EMRSAEQNGKVAIGADEGDPHFVRAGGGHFLELAGNRHRLRARSGIEVAVQRVDDVSRRKRRAVVEGDALANLEGPDSVRAVLVPGACKLRLSLHLRIDDGQTVIEHEPA